MNVLSASISTTFQTEIVDQGELPALLLLVAFGATFGITRFITHSIRADRFSWLGNIEAGDTHIHHLVWGICLLLASGLLAVALQPPLEVTAIVFGIGAALTLDEFALWLHLDDVYWSEQGRQSIDAVIVFVIVTGFMVLGAYPVSIETSGGIENMLAVIIIQVIGWAFVVVCVLKGKLIWGVFGIYFPPIAIVTATRLARPSSWWARKKYVGDKAPKLELAKTRYKGEETVVKPDSATSATPLPQGE